MALNLQSAFSTVVPPGRPSHQHAACAPRTVTLPLKAGTIMGTVTYKVDGKQRGLSRLTAARSVPLPDWQTRLRYRVWSSWHDSQPTGNWLQRGWRHVTDALRGVGRWFSDVF